MATVPGTFEDPFGLPPNTLPIALRVFIHIQIRIAQKRAEGSGHPWVEDALDGFEEAVNRSFLDDNRIEIDDGDDAASRIALRFLEEEIWAICYKFRDLASGDFQEAIRQNFSASEAHKSAKDSDFTSERTVEDIETVNGSVKELTSRLPKWMQRMLDVLMEALKLTRGEMD